MMQFQKASMAERYARARAVDPALYDRLMAGIWPRPAPDACWPVQLWRTKSGYGRLKVGGRTIPAHRAMFGLFFPGAPAPVVRHTCNNPSCINPAHLRGGTQKDNAEDRVISGRGGDLRGERNGRAKLSDADIHAIRKSSEVGAALARRFGVSNVLISKVRRRQVWRHLED
jgi:hypothetical protein